MSKMFRRFSPAPGTLRKASGTSGNRGNILQTTRRNRAVVGAGSCGRYRGIE